MHSAVMILAIAATVIVVARLCEPVNIPAPLALLGVGIVASFVPGLTVPELSPEVVLAGLLPPLLYGAALRSSLIDFRSYRFAILGLSVGLVLFTATGVAFVAQALLDVPFAVAFALGAIVAPPDAVAATAVARTIGLPRRITTILEGESMLNDATALVALRTAIAAAGLAADGRIGTITPQSVLLDFVWAVVGGVGVGVAVFLLIGAARRWLTETAADTALSFLIPFIAYLPAEEIGASGVLSVVTAGLLLAHKSPVLQDSRARMAERMNWSSITFLLENAVFLLIGTQMSRILVDVSAGHASLLQVFAVGLAVLATVIVLRPVWVIPFSLLDARRTGGNVRTRLADAFVESWAGMRGVVTLAAALTLPTPTPQRSVLIMIALIVTVGTLALQTPTLPLLAKALDVQGPDPREDALMEATVMHAAESAGLRSIEQDAAPSEQPVIQRLREQSLARVNRIWERLGPLGDTGAETPSVIYARLRRKMIDAERAQLLDIRDDSDVDQAVLSRALARLDVEEAALAWEQEEQADTTARTSTLRAPRQIAAACEHLEAAPTAIAPITVEGCTGCVAMGRTDWVHLRVCLECGYVGCCDSSPLKHASGHFKQSAHPVMRSLEPGEAWRWCFVDEVLA